METYRFNRAGREYMLALEDGQYVEYEESMLFLGGWTRTIFEPRLEEIRAFEAERARRRKASSEARTEADHLGKGVV